jgi:Asp-tRNA(Asn)/Glu-tRNA(Gln) amidotransferase A subunit family amidase
MTLEELAGAVRQGTVSAVELVTMSLERIERLDPPLNAVILVCADEALARAREVDARIGDGEDPGPLAGLPLLVKDMEDVAGLPSTYGSAVFADAPPATGDALVPRRLRQAGAIVVGKTNQPEFAFAGYTTNSVYGTTVNPWGTDWSPGGSSGGSGAALAAGMAVIATATDGGGSIRIPAAFCGLAGLKPTNGVIGRDPIPDWIDLSTCGPFATSMADIRLLLSLEAGPVPGDPSALPFSLPFSLPMSEQMPSRVIATTRFEDFGPLPTDVAERFDASLGSLERDLRLPVELVDPGSVFASSGVGDDWFTTCAFEHLHVLGRAFVEEQMDRFSPDFQGVMRQALEISTDRYMAARRRRFERVRDLDLLLGEDAVLAMPTMCVQGLLPDGRAPDGDRPSDSSIYNTDPQNMTGHPALSVPAGLCDNGIPFGLQITGPRFRDDLVLNVGAAWEAANPWPLTAPGYEPFTI